MADQGKEVSKEEVFSFFPPLFPFHFSSSVFFRKLCMTVKFDYGVSLPRFEEERKERGKTFRVDKVDHIPENKRGATHNSFLLFTEKDGVIENFGLFSEWCEL